MLYELGCGHPIGPLELSDFIGLDVVCDVADSIYAESRDAAVIVPNNLRRLVEAGQLGRKTGAGFYPHDKVSGLRPIDIPFGVH